LTYLNNCDTGRHFLWDRQGIRNYFSTKSHRLLCMRWVCTRPENWNRPITLYVTASAYAANRMHEIAVRYGKNIHEAHTAIHQWSKCGDSKMSDASLLDFPRLPGSDLSVFSERHVHLRKALLSPVRLSSVCLSVTLVLPTQAIQIFGNISTALVTLAIHWHPVKILRTSSQGNTSAGGVKHKTGSQV